MSYRCDMKGGRSSKGEDSGYSARGLPYSRSEASLTLSVDSCQKLADGLRSCESLMKGMKTRIKALIKSRKRQSSAQKKIKAEEYEKGPRTEATYRQFDAYKAAEEIAARYREVANEKMEKLEQKNKYATEEDELEVVGIQEAWAKSMLK